MQAFHQLQRLLLLQQIEIFVFGTYHTPVMDTEFIVASTSADVVPNDPYDDANTVEPT